MSVTLYRAEWDAITARENTPAYFDTLAKFPYIFDFDATFDALLRDPWVSDLVIPVQYQTPSVIVTEGDKTTELPLEVAKLSDQTVAIGSPPAAKAIEQ